MPYSRKQYSPFLHLIPLGGLEEVGKNMLVLECGQDILIIDMGLMFPSEDMPGVDYVIPDTLYLQKNKKKIRGVIITHGHLDHTGGIPYLIEKIGFPPIFAAKLTIGLIQERLKEFGLEKKTKLRIISPDETLDLRKFKINFFRVNHNIPDGLGLAIRTPVGLVVHTGDFKFDHTPQDQRPTEFDKIAKLGGVGVLVALSDSTNAEQQGYAMSEREIGQNLSKLFDLAKGRIIVTTFSSLISRLQQIIDASVSHGRKIAISGLSLEKNLEIALRGGYLRIPKSEFIRLKEILKFPPYKITIITTGSQGEEGSALTRMTRGEHREVKIQKGDTVILSSSPIPGNERAVHNLMNSLFRLGANVIYNRIFDVHVSGHAYQEELKLILSLLKPKFFVPIHGERHMLVQHAKLAEELGIKPENIFIMNNGQILEIMKRGQAQILKRRWPAGYVMVDGLGVGDVGNVVLRDRQVMAQDGMFVIIVTVDNETSKLVGEPDIISRGFIYMRTSERLLNETRECVKKIISSYSVKKVEDWSPIRNEIRDQIGVFLFRKTERRPMILPVVIEI